MQYKCFNEHNEIVDNIEDDYLINSIPEIPIIEDTYFRYDFNNGFRIQFINCEHEYFLIVRDLYTKYVYYNGNISPDKDTIYSYIKKYRIYQCNSTHKKRGYSRKNNI